MRRALLALAIAVSTLLAPATLSIGLTPAAAQDTIADKQREARRLSSEIAAQGRRISVLAEEYNLARIESDRIAAELDAAATALRATDAKAVELRATLKTQAVESYVRGGALPALAMLVETKTIDDISVRREYVDSVANRIGDTLDALRQVKGDLEQQRRDLGDARDDARAALAEVEAKRAEATAAQEEQERLLRQVEGELAELVAAEERRRAEAEAARVQEELAARRAREEAAAREAAARRAATTTTAAPRVAATPSTTAPRRTTTTVAPAGPPDGSDTGTTPPAPSPGAAAAIEEAKRQLGKPYEYGGSGPDTFDCSGLTAWAWRAGGKSLPHSSQAQWSATSRVDITQIAPGDLLFYGSPIHHVGLYVGDGQMIEAPETGKNVRYASIYRRDLVGAGRVN